MDPEPDRGPGVVLAVLTAAALAWIVLAVTHSSTLDHASLGGSDHQPVPGDHTAHAPASSAQAGLPWDFAFRAAVVVAGWIVMVVAMMLPPALPMLQLLRQLVARRRHPSYLIALGALVFSGVWLLVGLVMITGDALLHSLTDTYGWAAGASGQVAAGVLIGAGVYQFTPLKNICLRACRSPRSFALAHWRGQRPASTEVAAVSGAYALSCVGCCWALMTISFAVGAAALPVMVVLAVVMSAERLLPWGRHLVRPAGLILIALGFAIAFGLLPSGAHTS